MFLTTSRNTAGVYAFDIYPLGIRNSMVIDDKMPYVNGSWGLEPYFAGFDPIERAMWPILTEKVFAKYYGNYESIVGGWPTDAALVLTGSGGLDYDLSTID